MGAQRFLVGTVLGAVVLFAAGFLIFGLALANAYPVSSVDREAPLMLWLGLSQLGYGALLTAIIGNWTGASSAAGGFKAAAIVGFLLSISVGTGFYSMTTLPVGVMSYIDPLVSAIYYGIGGAAIGWWLGRGSPAQIADPA